MRPSLWFVVPAHGRIEVTGACLRQLARTCETLGDNGIDASAVVIACDGNLDTAAELGFGTVDRDNRFLGRRWNDGYELCRVAGVDYAIPFGSDDWIDPTLILAAPLPADDQLVCFRRAAFVREDGARLALLRIPYDGGLGIRVIPAAMLARARFRPADEDRNRALDASVWRGLCRALGRQPRLVYHDLHPLQIVDWKSNTQLNSYADCLRYLNGPESDDPFADLAEVYPGEALDEMRDVYVPQAVAA